MTERQAEKKKLVAEKKSEQESLPGAAPCSGWVIQRPPAAALSGCWLRAGLGAASPRFQQTIWLTRWYRDALWGGPLLQCDRGKRAAILVALLLVVPQFGGRCIRARGA